jgi:hypothetical protein
MRGFMSMNRIIIFPALMSLFMMTVSGQEDVKVIRSEFRTDKPGFENAWRSLSNGDRHYAGGVLSYPEALGEYTNAYLYNPDNPELNYKMGVCHLLTSKKEHAIDYFLKALSLKPTVAEDILLLTGRAYQVSGKFIDAVGKYTEFLESDVKKSPEMLDRVRKYIDESNAGMLIMNDTARIEISNAGEVINSPFDDYSPVLDDDRMKLYFASRRPSATKPAGKYQDELPDENIYLSTRLGEAWSVALPLEGKMNTAFCEAPLALADNGSTMYLYAGYRGDGDILVTTLKKGIWKKPKPINAGINSLFTETSVAFAPSGEEFVFVSALDRKGAGGKDIYIVKRIKGRRWGKPVTLSVLNSQWDEESVAYSYGGDTLWFSSRGHSTIGGFDVFYSVRNEDGTWGEPVNAGLPVNSVYDDMYFRPGVPGDSTFWLVTNRTGGYGGLDICIGRLMPPEPEPLPVIEEPIPEPVIVADTVKVVDTVYVVREVVKEVQPVVAEPVFYLEGRVLDSSEETPLVARIDIIDPETFQVVASLITSGEDGSFRVNVKNRRNYMFEVRSNGYLSDLRTLDIPAAYIGESFFTNFYLNKITVGKKVVLNNIFFETGKSILTSASYAELNKLTMIMNENPKMRIEISGHTDNTGSASVNDRLSLERATAVTQYLIGKGIVSTRIETKGYGSAQPVEPNDTPAGRAANRRVEFKILEF